MAWLAGNLTSDKSLVVRELYTLLLSVLLWLANASGSLVLALLQDLDDGIVLVRALKVVL